MGVCEGYVLGCTRSHALLMTCFAVMATSGHPYVTALSCCCYTVPISTDLALNEQACTFNVKSGLKGIG